MTDIEEPPITTTLGNIADATHALTSGEDLVGVALAVLHECTLATDSDAGALMLLNPQGNVESLASTSHDPKILALQESQDEAGPCLDSIATLEPVQLSSGPELTARWPRFGRALQASGFTTVLAQPMIWQGSAVGSLALYAGKDRDFTETKMTQTFADLATLAVVHAGRVSAAEAVKRMRTVLASRAVIEQAKGVLAVQENLDMASAYQRLVELSRTSQRAIGDVARQLITDVSLR